MAALVKAWSYCRVNPLSYRVICPARGRTQELQGRSARYLGIA